MGNNQSNHFPHIPEKVTWSLNTIINGKSQTLLSDFFEGRGGCTQAIHIEASPPQTADLYLGNSSCRPRFNVNHMRVKSPGLANAWPLGRAELAKAPSPGLTRLANAPRLPGG